MPGCQVQNDTVMLKQCAPCSSHAIASKHVGLGANVITMRWKLRTAAIAASLAATPAFADPITLSAADVGKSFSVAYKGDAGITGEGNFTLTSVSEEPSNEGGFIAYRFGYSITNTSNIPLKPLISGLGFNVSPDLTLAGSLTTNLYSNTALSNSQAQGLGPVDACFSTTLACGDSYSGLAPGSSETGGFMLGFAKSATSLNIDDFFLRYQTLTDTGALTSASATGMITSTSSGGTPVPEPDMLVLFSAAVAALAWYRRRAIGTQQRGKA